MRGGGAASLRSEIQGLDYLNIHAHNAIDDKDVRGGRGSGMRAMTARRREE